MGKWAGGLPALRTGADLSLDSVFFSLEASNPAIPALIPALSGFPDIVDRFCLFEK